MLLFLLQKHKNVPINERLPDFFNAENIREPVNLKPTHELIIAALWRHMTSTGEPNPVLLREELIINIYSPLHSPGGERFVAAGMVGLELQ
ncbi:hypothetical protein TNCV_2454801 [Trichonephila clavipes]|nr:hypothetical protein TNCV_2454801 [Trichonephila clavipes]